MPADTDSRPATGLVIAAPASGSGKTTVTIGLVAALARRGLRVATVKVGPDFIDPGFHRAAGAAWSGSLDLWAMRPETVDGVLADAADGVDVVLCEGVMGLFDGAVGAACSTASVAVRTGWPVLLVVDAHAMGASVAAVAHGFASFRPDVRVAAVVLNRTGGAAHTAMAAAACRDAGVAVLGSLPHDAALGLPERHLGLVQAGEHPDLAATIARAGAAIARGIDLDCLLALAMPCPRPPTRRTPPLAPPGRRVAVARDVAFAFAYESILDGWRRAGAAVERFSPLADEAPPGDADAVYLPGGYPELHAARIAGAGRFLDGLRAAARRGAFVYGECGGYMVLGECLVDAQGRHHPMAGLLPVATCFDPHGLTLGYREVTLAAPTAIGPSGGRFRGHEFHCARALREPRDHPLFHLRDAAGRALGPAGCRIGNVAGSFVHLVDRAADPATAP